MDFTNSHSLYPTVTTVNASAIATGHYIGDTGDFGNTLYVGHAHDQPERLDPGLSGKRHRPGRDEPEIRRQLSGRDHARWPPPAPRAGRPPLSARWVRPASRIPPPPPTATQTLIVDDATGHDGGLGLPDWFTANMQPGLRRPQRAPKTDVPDIEQEVWLMKATTRIVLPHFQRRRKAFRCCCSGRAIPTQPAQHQGQRGRDGARHQRAQRLAGTRNADTMLGELLAYLKATRPGQDHRCLRHRRSRLHHHQPCQRHQPVGPFRSGGAAGGSAIRLPGDRPGVDAGPAAARRRATPDRRWISAMAANCQAAPACWAAIPRHPDVVVAANGGSDLIYLPA